MPDFCRNLHEFTIFHHSFFKSYLIQSDQTTRHLNITAQRPQLLEFDHHTRWCCRDCNNAVASTSQLGGVDEEDEDEAWQLGWQLDGRCDANILGPWHVRDTKTWSRRSGLPICTRKKMWNEKPRPPTQETHCWCPVAIPDLRKRLLRNII